jgi:competence ComEA-like helix-hairpin-helix protein
MKIWPFWKYWYFTRSQRWGILSILSVVFLLLIMRGPVAEILQERDQQRQRPVNEQKYQEIRMRLKERELIKQDKRTATAVSDKNNWTKPGNAIDQKKAYAPKAIDINRATAEEWRAFRGIGPILSDRIISYRERLGGFYSVDQVAEVYGLSDSVFATLLPYLHVKSPQIRLIYVNRDDSTRLMEHPYISKTLAKQMVGYRERIQRYAQAEDLLKLYSMNDSLLLKIRPYLSFDH